METAGVDPEEGGLWGLKPLYFTFGLCLKITMNFSKACMTMHMYTTEITLVPLIYMYINDLRAS